MYQTEVITPTDEAHWLQLRTKDLTSTDIAALFGVSPYNTPFEIWHRKHSGEIPEFKSNERMTWGTRLEAVVAEGIAQDKGWLIAPMKDYRRIPDMRIGSSFDYRIINVGDFANSGIFEIKTVDIRAFKSGWIVTDDSLEAPAHIELQLQHQMLVSGLKWGYIGALVGGNDVRLIRRDADPKAHAAIIAKAAKFWASIESNEPPAPTYPADAEAVIRLNQAVDAEKTIDLSSDANALTYMAAYREASKDESDAKDRKDTARARLLELIGDAEKVKAGRYIISAGYQSESEIPAYTRKGFRMFRLTERKENKA